MQNLNNTNKTSDNAEKELRISDVIRSKGDTTKCYCCNRRYNYKDALHEDEYVKCPWCGHYMRDLSRIGGYLHPSYYV
jgi:anaerobic ribonucleoside-triphosphate reductase